MEQTVSLARQLGECMTALRLGALAQGSPDWDRAQSLVESVRLPHGGFACIVDVGRGLVCHPKLRANPRMFGAKVSEDPAAARRLGPGISVAALARNNASEIRATIPLRDLGANLLVHQPEGPLAEALAAAMAPWRGIGLALALGLSAASLAIGLAIARHYECALAAANGRLEAMVERRTEALKRTRDATIFGLAKLAESRDTDTGEHLERIGAYATLLAEELARRGDAEAAACAGDIALAASLHDIGKVAVPDAVLLKPGKLTPEERLAIETHAERGAECLAAIEARLGEDDFLQLAREIAHGHHERWDGAGYPRRLSGPAIPLAARIVAVADVYDALRSRRPYKQPMTHEEARKLILASRGNHFDPAVADAFLALGERFRAVPRADDAPAAPAQAPAEATATALA